MRLTLLLVSAVVSGLLVAACGAGSIGDTCDQRGATRDICEEGAVCAFPSSKATQLECVPICGKDSDCAPGYDCKEVDPTKVKGCRLKD